MVSADEGVRAVLPELERVEERGWEKAAGDFDAAGSLC